MVPPVTMVSVPGSVPAGAPMGTTMGNCASSTPSDARSRCSTVPSCGAIRGTPSPRCRWPEGPRGRWWPPPDRASSPGRRGPRGGPTQESLGVGHRSGQQVGLGRGFDPAFTVPVEQAGQHGHAVAIDRGERGHHGGHRHSAATGRSPSSAGTARKAFRGPPTRPFWRRGGGGRVRGPPRCVAPGCARRPRPSRRRPPP